MSDETVLEGLLSIRAALHAGSRAILALWVRDDDRDQEIIALAREVAQRGIAVRRATLDEISAQASGKSHGGVIALVGPRNYAPLESLAVGSAFPFVAMLDGVEDPFNFGLAVRALYAAGAEGLVVRPRNWMSAAGVVARASAGASELMPTAVADTVEEAAVAMRARGLKVACAIKGKSVSIYEAQLAVPLFLVIGGEKRGISRSFIEKAELRLEIPYGRKFAQSLGTASATAVLAFEVMRQRARRLGR